MDSSNNPETAGQHAGADGGVRNPVRARYHEKIYLALLIFVVVGGLPMVGVSSLRARFRDRIRTLRSAAMGERAMPPPALARVGENREPLPKEYQRPQARASYLPIFEAPKRTPFRIVVGGEETALVPREATPGAPKSKPAQEIALAPISPGAKPASGDAGTGSQYRKGKSEQEAYDLVAGSNLTLAGMIKGADPALKFQDWAALSTGQDSYNVMVTFVQTADNVIRKYIWGVKVDSKEVTPLSSYAMGISK